MDIQSSQYNTASGSEEKRNEPLTYEETPPIEPILHTEPDLYPPPKPRNSFASIITALIVLALLGAVVFWLSGYYKQFTNALLPSRNQQQNISPTPSPKSSAGSVVSTTGEQTRPNIWNQYPVLNGKTRVVYDGITFKLPPEVFPPICDGSTCRSQGTYLPGGTRFTVALRGEGQVLPDYRNRIISDLKGIPFPLKDTLLLGKTATEFSGVFVGTTVGGYIFSQMRGYMIPITDTIAFEINHFAPSGIVADFAKDDVVFDQIVQTLVLPPGNMMDKGGVGSPSATPTK